MERLRWMIARWRRAQDRRKALKRGTITPYQWQLFMTNQAYRGRREYLYGAERN